MNPPTIYDLRNDADSARFGLSTTNPTRNSGGLPARDYMLRCRIENRNGGSPKFIVLHIQEGWTRGSLEHWTAGRYESGAWVQASSTVMIQKDGSVLRVIPEQHGPWTNGQVRNPTAQAAGLLALGPDPNKWSLTIEAEGLPGDAMPQAQLDAVVWQVGDWMERYGIPSVNILPHSSIDSVERSRCPGSYYRQVMTVIDSGLVIDGDGGGSQQGEYVQPSPPPPYDGEEKTINDVVFHPYRRQVTSKGVNRRLWATPTAPLTGPTIPAGVKIDVLYWIQGEPVDGNTLWLIGESGSRIWSGGVEEDVP